MQKKGVAPSIVIILAIFLIVISIVGIITINDRINSKVNDLASKSSNTNVQGQVSVVIEPPPAMGGEVSVNITEPNN